MKIDLIQFELDRFLCSIVSSGGVENATLEIKTKDTKEIQGRELTFRGQTLARPKTEMVEAKDQGHNAQVF